MNSTAFDTCVYMRVGGCKYLPHVPQAAHSILPDILVRIVEVQ